MKKIISFLLFLLPLVATAQQYLPDNTYGKIIARQKTTLLMGIPKDTFTVLPEFINDPHIASTNDTTLWLWGQSNHIWNRLIGGGGGGLTFEGVDSIITLFYLDTAHYYLTEGPGGIDTLHNKYPPNLARQEWVTQYFVEQANLLNTNYFQVNLTQDSTRTHDANGWSEHRINGDSLIYNYNYYRFNGIPVAADAESIMGFDVEGALVQIPYTLPAQVKADWEATEGPAEILNKPTLLSDFENDLYLQPTAPLSQIVYGTGTGVTSEANLKRTTSGIHIGNGTANNWRIHTHTNSDVVDGVWVQNFGLGTAAQASFVAVNADSVKAVLTIGSPNKTDSASRNRAFVAGTRGLSIGSNGEQESGGQDDIKFFPGGYETAPMAAFKPNRHVIIGDSVDTHANISGRLLTVKGTIVADSIIVNGSSIGNGGNGGTEVRQVFTNSTSTTKTLAYTPLTGTLVRVLLNGFQQSDLQYSITGSNLILNFSPLTSETITVEYTH